MSQTAASPPGGAGLAQAAPGIFVFLWSTGFIGARYGLPYAEPFTFLSLRFAIVIALLVGLTLALRAPWPRGWRQWGHAAVAGALLQGAYLGGVFFAIDRGMPAGMASLIVSMQPILTAVLAGPMLGERVAPMQWAGLLLGFVGVVLVVSEKLGPAATFGAAALAATLIALVATSVGTIYQKRFGGKTPLLGGAVAQYVASAALLLPGALFFETREVTWNLSFILAMAWLVGALSLGAILLLLVLLRRHSAARVSSLFYLVPPATALEAYLLFGERLGPQALVGMAVALAGVVLVTRGGGEQKAGQQAGGEAGAS